MGEKAYSDMLYGLYRRAGIPDGFTPYDLRDTLASIVFDESKSWSITERLLRHAVQGQGKAYVKYALNSLCQDLERLSPLRVLRISQPTPDPTMAGSGKMSVVETGENPSSDTPLLYYIASRLTRTMEHIQPSARC